MSFAGETLSDDEDFKKVTEANFQKIRNKSNKLGYAEGLSDGKEAIFQTVFDNGYTHGLRTGFELEKYRSFFENLSILKVQNEELNKEKALYSKMSVDIATDPSHCYFAKHNKEPLDAITHHQNTYVDTFLRQCQQTLPLTTNLLASQK
ncbi:PREDICTED: putative tRNA 2'-phosphotransferase [Rhagoletis zephyria]|uniref:putative tRNA 2'-phosphotransferase n=1 Tax=Rhagoletis zephyria TaxID=28612 RepID=UPI0008116579|nr:PREDICTED: putative tRNA 2'-phosphotransferase [Rhagoletis zephyria]